MQGRTVAVKCPQGSDTARHKEDLWGWELSPSLTFCECTSTYFPGRPQSSIFYSSLLLAIFNSKKKTPREFRKKNKLTIIFKKNVRWSKRSLTAKRGLGSISDLVLKVVHLIVRCRWTYSSPRSRTIRRSALVSSRALTFSGCVPVIKFVDQQPCTLPRFSTSLLISPFN